MSIGEQFIGWIADTYSLEGFLKAWGSLLALCMLLHVAERVRPAERNQPYRAMMTNGTITLVYAVLTPVALLGANSIAAFFFATLIRHLTGPLDVIDLNELTSGYSVIVKYALLAPLALLPLLVYDFFYYWFHRLQHVSAWLWEQHKLHHSDHALNVTTSFRINWLEEFFKTFLVTIPMGLVLGLQPFQIGIVATATGTIAHFWGLYLHSNIRLSYGPLNPVVTGPQYHRIHHSIEPRHQYRNFSTHFPIWDVLFGTYYRPAHDEYPQTGVAGEPSNPGMLEVLFGPLMTWGSRIVRFTRSTRADAAGKIAAPVRADFKRN